MADYGDTAAAVAGRGTFPDGSVGSKVQGTLNFLDATDNPDAYAVIGPLHAAAKADTGKTGTRITKT